MLCASYEIHLKEAYMTAPFILKWTLLDVASTKKDSGNLFSPQSRAMVYQHFNSSPKERNKYHLGRDQRMNLSCNVMLIEYMGRIILVDTGPPDIGDSSIANEEDIDSFSINRLQRTLRDQGITAGEVTDVVLTSKDRDHAGGTIYSDRAGKHKVRFAKATHHCHRGSKQRARPQSTPQADLAFSLMEQSGQLNYIEEEEELAPGVRIIPAFGPSAYASMVQIEVGADRIIFAGDVCPTSYHVIPDITSAYDDDPERTFAEKQACVGKSLHDGYLLAFCHAVEPKTCWVEESKQGLSLRTP